MYEIRRLDSYRRKLYYIILYELPDTARSQKDKTKKNEEKN